MKRPTLPTHSVTKLWTGVALALILLVALASNMAGISAIEFTGEDEIMFMQTGLTFLHGLLGHFGRMAELFVFYYPPLQCLLPVPFMVLWGASEWTMRIPGVLAGVFTCGMLYVVVRQCGADRRAALFTCLFYAISGIAGNNKFALTCGVLAPGLIVAVWGLLRFRAAADERTEGRALLWCAAGLVWAVMSLQDGLFYIPVVALAYWRKKGLRISRSVWWPLAILAGGVAAYVLLWIALPRLFLTVYAGGFAKVKLIFSQLGAFRITDLMYSFYAGSSLPAISLAVLLLPLALARGSSGLRWLALFYVFPLALWTFAFNYPNVRAAHMLNAFPAFCALWACGALVVWDMLRRWPGVMARLALIAWALLIVWSMAATALQNIALYATDRIPTRLATSLGPMSQLLPQGRRYECFGQHAAGIYVRQHTSPDQGVICSLGGSFAAYYAHRPGAGMKLLVANGNDTNLWERSNTRYLVVVPSQPLRDGAPSLSELKLAAEVVIAGRKTLAIYDLWNATAEPITLDGDVGRAQFVRQGTPWREMVR